MAKHHHGMSPQNRFSATEDDGALFECAESASKSPDTSTKCKQLTCQLSDDRSQCTNVDNCQAAWNSTIAAPETVSDATHGFDQPAMFTQLLSQTHDLTIDGALCGWVIRPLNGLNDLLTRMHCAGMAGQKVQQSKLCLCQRKWLALDEDFVGRWPKNNPVDFSGVRVVEHRERHLQ
jgi:hypothetical protein